MNRVMSNTRLMILIRSNDYLAEILSNCESANELKQRLVRTNCLQTICLIDINWTVVYKNLKEVIK